MILPVPVAPDLLQGDVAKSIYHLSKELLHAYRVRQIFRTETEARVSVLDDIHHPTRAAKYWQCIREQTVMLEQLATLSFEYRRNEVTLKRHRKTLASSSDEFAIEEAQIGIDECLFKQANMTTVAADRAREIGMWAKLKAELDDGSFDTNNVDTHQLVSYTTQFALRAAHANPASMSAGELDNLAGLLQTSLKRCRELGVLDQLRRNLPVDVVTQLQLEAP